MSGTSRLLSVMPAAAWRTGADEAPVQRLNTVTPVCWSSVEAPATRQTSAASSQFGTSASSLSMAAREDVMEDFRADLRRVVGELHDEVQRKLDEYVAQRMGTMVAPELTACSSTPCDKDQTVLVRAGQGSTCAVQSDASPKPPGSVAERVLRAGDQQHSFVSLSVSSSSDARQAFKSHNRCRIESPPVIVPKALLQMASIDSESARGEDAATEATIAAGFLGGGGTVMQICWVFVGLWFLGASFDHSAHPHAVSDCGAACTAMRVIHKVHMVMIGFCCCFRSFLLRIKLYRYAHGALMMMLTFFISFTVINSLIAMYLLVQEGCSWRTDDYIFQELGTACAWVGGIECLYNVAYAILATSIAPAMWHLRSLEAERIFTVTTILHCLYDLVCVVVAFALQLNPRRVLFFMSGTLVSVFTIVMFVCRRRLIRRRAWNLVKEDAQVYEEDWEAVSSKHSEGIRRLTETASAVSTDIRVAVIEGPIARTSKPENLRRSLLRFCAGDDGGLRQDLGALPLLYAQAHALHPILQRKAAEWAAGLGQHVPAAVKQPQRAVQKVWRIYRGNPQPLVDLVRCSIICESPDDILLVLNRIRSDDAAKIMRIKNRFNPLYDSAASGGYRNLSLNIIIVNSQTHEACAERHICEVQVGLRVLQELKTDGGHRRFVSFRDMRAE
eukprot:TRINITY_DN14043_c0_g1_i1.p1 TRINITY_DN14043_c0_g1~~TRINITY_DN14043_c0_g1_i1.p1  ORF type:complete len:672 (-),score=58.91 TRINITY_DN14043_c0_g1_i1:264-2279(-)